MENDNFIGIPPRMPNDDFSIMQSFVYEIGDFNLGRKFEEALSRKKPFKNFRALIDYYPKLKEQWFAHRDKEIVNEAMNCLCDNDIELEDKSFIPKIDIRELAKDQVKLQDEWKTFGHVACVRCNNKEGIRT